MRIGIFWIIGDDIITFKMPLARAPHVGGFADYPHAHADLWPFVTRRLPHLRRSSYEYLPRGRVTHDADSNTFNLLVPSRFVGNKEIISKLVEQFGLEQAQVRVIPDEHYDPPPVD